MICSKVISGPKTAGQVEWYQQKTKQKNILLNSSRPPCLFGICLPPKTTAMGRPNLSSPCKNILLCAISFGISVGEMYPLGKKLFLHFRYFNNIVEALSTSRSLARRNLLIAKSSSSYKQLMYKPHIRKNET